MPKYEAEHQYTTNDYVTREEVEKIIAKALKISLHPDRDALLISIGWETGGRVTEVLQLVPEHVLESSIVLDNLKQKLVKGKHPTKIVEASKELCNWIKDYCSKEKIERGELIFHSVRDKKKQLGRDQVQVMITAVSEAAGVYRLGKNNPRTGGRYKGISFHVLRHSNATYLLRKIKNTRMVQQQLGHASIVSTQKYANVAFDDVKAEVAKANMNIYHP